MGDAKTFKSGREFAAFLGLVPRQSGLESLSQLPENESKISICVTFHEKVTANKIEKKSVISGMSG
jgi:hypothetical protein